jgi:cytoskeletal protein RodZ
MFSNTFTKKKKKKKKKIKKIMKGVLFVIIYCIFILIRQLLLLSRNTPIPPTHTKRTKTKHKLISIFIAIAASTRAGVLWQSVPRHQRELEYRGDGSRETTRR